ncbi:MAG: GNAT family N-acetyltransferase [Lentisphaerae bacterium]|nr:GNAT family N-acetyltransferase [Lentisphaerota bacterium]
MSVPLAQPEPCELLPWDTAFFGFRIGRVRGDALTMPLAHQVDAWSRQNALRCLYLLAQADDPVTTCTAEDHGFRLVDVRVTFERQGLADAAGAQPKSEPASCMRLARPDDLGELQAQARSGFTDTRFFYDTGFPRHLAESLYATWITLECQGRAQAVWVCTSASDHPVGYISCHVDPSRSAGEIGLVGVSSQAQGRGVGQALVFNALRWFAAQGVGVVTVVTQGRNRAAQRLYQRCGFLTSNLQLWYHKWYPAQEQAH